MLLGLVLALPVAAQSPIKNKVQENSYVVASYPVYEPIKTTITTEYKADYRIIKAIPSPLGYNCWTYASSKRQLPQGLTTLQEKESKIKTKKPSNGSVGLTAEGSSGHLVVIEKIKDQTLVISEGNYKHGYITWREIPKSKVLGYY